MALVRRELNLAPDDGNGHRRRKAKQNPISFYLQNRAGYLAAHLHGFATLTTQDEHDDPP
jgi:hypothetical protein